MNSGKIIAALIGVWLLFIGIDSANGRVAKKGAMLLGRPLQLFFTVTRVVRTLLLFKLAVITFLLVARQLVTPKKCCKDKEE